ncbi:DUF3540 domain-containing protein [Caballeronia sp. LZ034LL]|uniref:DUF3540 domain-containing protein n=1 Tax=Caballeronia sp. LZ034LL TaxID=3038567 RepID=UPI0028640B43|nr:DUF3540 domain-containing protein [Caballeronia sp. LZ034LL]MDR5837111.1 DUF3540 domain-containing protein [Caballeronia sp. LZ034LL]
MDLQASFSIDPALRHGATHSMTRDPALTTASVTGRAGEWFYLDGQTEGALRAASCLLEPQPGDLVLVCDALPAHPVEAGVTAAVSVAYVLAVLVRSQATATATLALPGGTALESADGELRVRAPRITLEGADQIRASTREFALDSVSASIVSHRAQARIGALDAGIERLSLVAKSFVSTVGQLLSRVQDSTRRIEGNDDLHAGSAHWRVEGHAHMHTRHTTLMSDEVTRVDGSKIELG